MRIPCFALALSLLCPPLASAKSAQRKRGGAAAKRCSTRADCVVRSCGCRWRVLRRGTREARRCKATWICRSRPPAKPTPLCIAGKCVAARPPRSPWSKELICARDADCVFLATVCYVCPPCGVRWRPVIGRRWVRLQRRRHPKPQPLCAVPKCRKCKGRWLGSKAVCVKRQCAVRP